MSKSIAKYDVIVIGLGPAGATCVKEMKNKSVLGIDKSTTVGSSCGGGIGIENIKDYDIDVPHDLSTKKIKKAIISTPDEKLNIKAEDFKRDHFGVVTDRRDFDMYNLLKLKETDADIELNTYVHNIKRKNGLWVINDEFKSDYLILGDGANSKCAQRIGIDTSIPDKDIFVCVQEFLSTTSDTMHLIFDEEISKKGYGWIFPDAQRTHVGLGEPMNEYTTPKLYEKLDLLKKKYGLSSNAIHHEGGIVPLSKPHSPLVYEYNLALIGDAGRLVDPITGGGIHYAIHSGRTVANVLSKRQPLSDYQIKMRPIIKELTRRYKFKNVMDKLGVEYTVNEMIKNVGEIKRPIFSQALKKGAKRVMLKHPSTWLTYLLA